MIAVLAELERVGYSYEYSSADEVKVCCPFHDDSKPSCSVNIAKALFKCQTAGCEAEGDVITLLARILKTDRVTMLAELSTRYDMTEEKTIDGETVERYHKAIWKASALLNELYKRGVTDEDIREHRLGEHEGRIIIPIDSASGMYVNLRKYLPGAPGPDKMRNSKGRGKDMRYYPWDQLRYDTIVLTGGEVKAIVGKRNLNPHNVGCITVTNGEGNWDPALNHALKGKRIIICNDIDEAGQLGAEARCAILFGSVDWIGNLVLPLDKDKYPTGDINDFIGQEKGDLFPLLETVEQWLPKQLYEEQYSEPEDVTLNTAVHANYANKRVRLTSIVTAIDTAPYVIPSKVKVTCDKSQPFCGACPVMQYARDVFPIREESPVIIEMVNETKYRQREALMRGLGIPPMCRVCEFEALSYYNVEDARISPQLEITTRSTERVMQPALCIGDGVELNETYSLVGRMHPHPKTQQSTLLISKYKPTKDALSQYVPTNLEELELFQPSAWTQEAVTEKLAALYSDFEANVTRIYQRPDLHLIIDLAYHSPLLIPFDNKVRKGWVEILVVGDSAQGKSECAMGMMQHYGLGEKVECKNASVAGLLGGLQQSGNRWFVTWGVIPTHDRRLVIYEEVKGAHTEVIAKLTDMRSSGIAEIPKIEKRRTHARTRGVWLSNPRGDYPVGTHNFGIETIKNLIGGLEDIRRFDAALIVAANEVDSSIINMPEALRPRVESIHTNELCRRLILWTWTRADSQVIYSAEATDAILQRSTELCNEFTDAIPLVDRGSMRLKLARLSASLAGRTFSTSDDPLQLLVRDCHVHFISDYLRRIYGSSTFGYRDFTEALNLSRNLTDPDAIKSKLTQVPFPKDFMESMLHTAEIELVDIQDWCSWARPEAMDMLSFLVRKHAVTRDGRSYRKTPEFIRMLREVLAGKDFEDRPGFLPETREF